MSKIQVRVLGNAGGGRMQTVDMCEGQNISDLCKVIGINAAHHSFMKNGSVVDASTTIFNGDRITYTPEKMGGANFF